MSEPIPVLKYSFDSCIPGSSATTVTNEGSYTGMDGTFVKVNSGKYEIIQSANSPTGKNYLSFTGGSNSNGAYISLPTFTFGGSAWSVCFWYNKAANTINETSARIFDFSTPVTAQKGFGLYFYGGTGQLSYYQYDANHTGAATLNSTSCLDGVWRHVAFVFDTSINKYKIYFNGVLFSIFNWPTIENYTRSYCFIGKSMWGSDSYPTYLLDDFRLYDCTLSQSNISSICGNTFYNNNVLVSSLFNSYVPSGTSASTTGFCMFKSGLDLCKVYAPYSSGSHVPSGFYSTVIFNPWTSSSCRNYMTVDKGDNSARIGQWYDKSNHNNNFIQSNNNTLFIDNDVYMNNTPSACFSGQNNMYLNCTTFTETWYALSLYALVYYKSRNDSYPIELFATSDLTSNISATIQFAGTGTIPNQVNGMKGLLTVYTNSSATYYGFDASANTPYILTLTLSTTSSNRVLKFYVNGELKINDTLTTTSQYSINVNNVRISSTLDQQCFIGGISAIALYNTVLSSTEQQQVEGYISWKNLGTSNALYSSHTYKSISPIDIGYYFNTRTV